MNTILKKIGVVLLLVLYVMSGIKKIFTFNDTSKALESKFPIKFPLWFFKLSMVGVIILLTAGSGFLLYDTFFNVNKLISILIIIAMIIFTIMATFLFHPPLTDKIHFMKNTSIVGAFFLLLSSHF
jgi:uncharacterized membrane protein YphA (DoxX/SURF4 family)